MLFNNSAYLAALQAPGRLEGAGKGHKVLVYDALSNFFCEVFDTLDSLLASLPGILKKYDTKGYETEALQRAVLRDGFPAVEASVYNNTLEFLEKSGFYPSARKDLARKNVEAIPKELKREIEVFKLDFDARLNELSEVAEVSIDDLRLNHGRLRFPTTVRESIPAKFTTPVEEKTFKVVEKIRSVAATIAEVKKSYPPVVYDLIGNLVAGREYTDEELVSTLVKDAPTK